MPLTKIRNSLYIPGQGEVSLSEKDVIPINHKELVMLSWLHEFAAKHQINIFCKNCEQPVRGNNQEGQQVRPSVSCQCREFRYGG